MPSERALAFVTRRAARLCALLLLTTSATPVVSQTLPPADPFLARHVAAVAENRYRSIFSIRFKDGRSIFKPGERIQVEMVDPGGYTRPAAQAVLDHENGVSQPLRPLAVPFIGQEGGICCGVMGGIVGGPPLPPSVTRLTLNDRYRFDAPGRYRMFVQAQQMDRLLETSNVLTFEISERDRAWETATLQRAVRVLERGEGDAEAVSLAVADLRALANNATGAELARRIGRGTDLRDYNVMRTGLFAVQDRGFVVGRLEAELSRPQRHIAAWFVRDLALLELARRHPDGPYDEAEYLGLIERYSTRRAHVLRDAGTLKTAIQRELEEAGQTEHFLRGALGAALHRYPAEAIGAFESLAAAQQYSLLLNSWRRFAYPAFAPLLARLYESPTGGQPLRDIALIRLNELSPNQNRRALVDDAVARILPARPTEPATTSRAREPRALAWGPTPGNESHIRFISDGGRETQEEFERRIAALPSGTRVEWDDWNGDLDGECWTLSERLAHSSSESD
jgi:hypothetical protein